MITVTYNILIPVSLIIEKFDIAIFGTNLVICGWAKILNILNASKLDAKV